VFDFLNIYPGYWESDVGWVFLPFFSLFFAMIVGDAGYAILLLLLTVFLQRRLKKVPPHVFHMMYIAGFATLVWGVLTGSYFGIPTLPRYAEALQVAWIADRDNLIELCFLIGAVHLSIAHVWNAVSLGSRGAWTKVLAQIGWLTIVWSMFFLARQTVLGRDMPSFLLYMLGVGFVLVVVFMKTPAELKGGWIDHALLPLTMIGNFVDILSYIRLFAVGYASIAVLAAFNGMASSIGFDSVLTAVAASLLLLFANALNIMLAGLGVLVHAVRLNTLEFSTHKGLTWAGYNLYTPFAARREAGR
jgi:V/A-type H+-transporting ATPase subunit I